MIYLARVKLPPPKKEKPVGLYTRSDR
jgi:hypothetical protein